MPDTVTALGFGSWKVKLMLADVAVPHWFAVRPATEAALRTGATVSTLIRKVEPSAQLPATSHADMKPV